MSKRNLIKKLKTEQSFPWCIGFEATFEHLYLLPQSLWFEFSKFMNLISLKSISIFTVTAYVMTIVCWESVFAIFCGAALNCVCPKTVEHRTIYLNQKRWDNCF